jgi:hypothetical protein
VTVDGRHWVDNRTLEWLQFIGRGIAGFPLIESQMTLLAGADERAGRAPGEFSVLDMKGTQYVLFDEAHPAKRQLCGPELASAVKRRGLSALRRALCPAGAEPSAPEPVKMRVSLLTNATSCGPSDAFLGCGHADNSVEITFDGARYWFFDVFGADSISVGRRDAPEFSGSAILLHEVGHWFGLPHIGYRPDLIPDYMQDTYQDNACYSLLAFQLMVNMDEQQHARRLGQGAGLKRPPSRAAK